MGYKISDVAKRAKVSPSTVSRILRNEKGFSYSEKTKQKVFSVVNELDYSPNPAASLFRMKKTNLVGIAVQPDNSYATFRMIAKCFEQVSALGYTPVMVGFNGNSGNGGIDLFGNLKLLRGVICLYSNQEIKTVDLCKKHNLDIPIVVLFGKKTDSDNVRSVRIDSINGVKNAVKYLYDLGHRSLAFISFKPEKDYPDSKRIGFYQGIEECGMIATDVFIDVTENQYFKEGRNAASKLGTLHGVTAAVCSNDEVAVGLLAGLEDLNINVPGDFSVIGFDDLPFAEYAKPGLTTIRQDFALKAETASKLLVSLIEMTESQQDFIPNEIVLDCELMVRNTTAKVISRDFDDVMSKVKSKRVPKWDKIEKTD